MAQLSCDSSTPYFASYEAIAQSLRCPMCGGQRISSSQSSFALSIKRDICTHLHEGMEAETIISTLEQDYGQSLRIENDLSSFNLFLLVAPIAMLTVAAIVIRRTVGRKT